MKKAVKSDGKIFVTNKALFVPNVVIPVITGSRTRNVANANSANIVWALLHKLRLAMTIQTNHELFKKKIYQDSRTGHCRNNYLFRGRY